MLACTVNCTVLPVLISYIQLKTGKQLTNKHHSVQWSLSHLENTFNHFPHNWIISIVQSLTVPLYLRCMVIASEACGALLALIISYSTRASEIIVLLKNELKYKKLKYDRDEKIRKYQAHAYHIRSVVTWLIFHNSYANENSWIALSNDLIFNTSTNNYTVSHTLLSIFNVINLVFSMLIS